MRYREVIHVSGLSHGANPIPVAVRIGPTLTSGSLSGRHPESGDLPEEPAAEIEQAFGNLELVLRRAGLGLEHVLRVDVRLRDAEDRDLLNHEWARRFPDPDDRPVRHTSAGAPDHLRIQLEVTATDPTWTGPDTTTTQRREDDR